MKKTFRNLMGFGLIAVLVLCGWPLGQAAAAESTGESFEKKDSNNDGKIDTWIQRDSAGNIMMIAKDENKDGKPDHWVYYRKNGKPYKREWDRNKDGKPDYRVMEDNGRFLESRYDDNFDGKYDRIQKAPAKGSSGITKTTATS